MVNKQQQAQPAHTHAKRENGAQPILKVLEELRNTYMQLEQVATHAERISARSARTIVEDYIEIMQMLHLEIHNERITDFATCVRISDLQLRTLQTLLHQVRQGFGRRMQQPKSASSVGIDDGGMEQ